MKLTGEGAYDVQGRRKYLSRDEGLRFLQEAAALVTRQRLLCQVLFYTGCRVSEAIPLKRANIDEPTNRLLFKSLKKRGKTLYRRIPVPATLIRDLMKLETLDEDRLWIYSRTTVWRIVKTTMTRAGISGVHATCKGLRHAFGVRCALATIPLPHVQRWMGHADSKTTSIYLDVRDEEECALMKNTWS